VIIDKNTFLMTGHRIEWKNFRLNSLYDPKVVVSDVVRVSELDIDFSQCCICNSFLDWETGILFQQECQDVY
jgi:hypothetical protein